MSFRFKQFSVEDNRCAMKVGTDAVLLGAWVAVNHSLRILDIGTGCGVIALQIAQRTESNVHIDAVEIEMIDAGQAQENIVQSPWPQKIFVYSKPIQFFVPDYSYDLIVTNPPYFVNSLQPPTPSRAQARHTSTLSFPDLIQNSARLLKPDGRLALILPTAEGNIFKELAHQQSLYLIRETAVYTTPHKPQERWLLEFSRSNKKIASDKIVLFNSSGKKTPAYENLTAGFYL